MDSQPSDRPSKRPTPRGRSYVGVRGDADIDDEGTRFRAVPTDPAPPRTSATVPILPLRCATLAQFSRLYVGHIRAGKLRLAKHVTAERGRVFVRAILPGGIDLDFPGELVDDGDGALVRFDRVSVGMHERVARIVSGG